MPSYIICSLVNKMLQSYMKHVRGEKYNVLVDIIFTPFSLISSWVISFMNFLRLHGLLRTQEPPLPLISVGNITYGGTNKTPFVEMLAKFAVTRNVKAGIVTRGYSGKSQSVNIILNGEGNRDLTGDEPLLLSRELPEIPVAVARQRIEGVNKLKASGCELVIADDAFQHRSLSRDVDIVLIDAICPFGSGKLIPAGIMREKINAVSRADIVVLTKSEQVTCDELESLRELVSRYISPERIFTSRLEDDGWIGTEPPQGSRVFAFSAIGSPESFRRSIVNSGLVITGEKHFRDHHRYTLKDLEYLCCLAKKSNAEFMICTQKDLFNMPDNWSSEIPLVIPKVKAVVNEAERFFETLTNALKPKIIVASNGYGEDSIGVMLAKKLRRRFRESEIWAFPLVGRGDAYTKEGFEVKSAPSVTPSGGVLKYSLKDLLGDMRAGLLKHVRAQLGDWNKIANSIRTPICVGDVYLLLHTLWGSGARPLFTATAKTVYLTGHWRLERALINKFTLRTWTRDAKSAEQLGDKAVYSGSPIMDLLYEDENYDPERNYSPEFGDVILLLPGSRLRACRDVKLLLDAAEILNSQGESKFRMVLAPTLPVNEFLTSCESYGWKVNNNLLVKKGISIELTSRSIASSTQGVKILLGLGGTANQLCAGLGIPVISVDEKGKRVQKKLLGDSEILTENKPEALAESVLRVLRDKELYSFMSNSGRTRMGSPGALDDIVNYAGQVMGWDIRESVYKKMQAGT
ncbi:MAG: tetraacyldisaccharide 4'-kinase [Synergistaceae bacterium]|nr:tetraacyldisaccharide 4'-kinase [Synergistaceae bacterium]